jgi:hypothetical protein
MPAFLRVERLMMNGRWLFHHLKCPVHGKVADTLRREDLTWPLIPTMIFKMIPRYLLSLAVIGFVFAVPQAKAAITITFSFNGVDTIGVLSGSINLPVAPAANDVGGGYFRYVGTGSEILYVHVVGNQSYDHYTGGSNPSSVNLRMNGGAGFLGTQSFGFDRGSLYTAYDAVPGSTYAPTGTFIWPRSTLQAVGVSGLTTPIVVYRASNGEEIQFVTAVPEPGTALLGAIGAIGLIFRRRRDRAMRTAVDA